MIKLDTCFDEKVKSFLLNCAFDNFLRNFEIKTMFAPIDKRTVYSGWWNTKSYYESFFECGPTINIFHLCSARQLLPATSPKQQHSKRISIESLHIPFTTAHNKFGCSNIEYVHCQWSYEPPLFPSSPLAIFSSSPSASPAECHSSSYFKLPRWPIVHVGIWLSIAISPCRCKHESTSWSQ